jgi:hypothetical protein
MQPSKRTTAQTFAHPVPVKGDRVSGGEVIDESDALDVRTGAHGVTKTGRRGTRALHDRDKSVLATLGVARVTVRPIDEDAIKHPEGGRLKGTRAHHRKRASLVGDLDQLHVALADSCAPQLVVRGKELGLPTARTDGSIKEVIVVAVHESVLAGSLFVVNAPRKFPDATQRAGHDRSRPNDGSLHLVTELGQPRDQPREIVHAQHDHGTNTHCRDVPASPLLVRVVAIQHDRSLAQRATPLTGSKVPFRLLEHLSRRALLGA